MDMDTGSASHYPIWVEPPKYRSLNSMPATLWDTAGISNAAIPPSIAKGAPFDSAKIATYRHTQQGRNEVGLSPGMINAIFAGTSRKEGSERLGSIAHWRLWPMALLAIL